MNLNEERALMKRAQTNVKGFGELFDIYYERIYAYAYRRIGARQNAEDIAASVFEDALRGIQKYRWQNKPIAAWLYKIAARRVADFYRSGARREVGQVERGDEGIEKRVSEYVSVRESMNRLSESDREMIRLTFFDELETEEIAALLTCTANSVYVRVHRALKRLRAIMQEEAK